MRSFTILVVVFLAAVVRTGNAFQIPQLRQKQQQVIFHQASKNVITTNEAKSRKATATEKAGMIATIGFISAMEPANAFEINVPGDIVLEISPLDVAGYGSIGLGLIYGYSYWYYYDKKTKIEKAAAEKKAALGAKKKAKAAEAAAAKAKKEKEAAPVLAAKEEEKKVKKAAATTNDDEKVQPDVVKKEEQNNEVYVPKEEELELPELKMTEMNAAKSKSGKRRSPSLCNNDFQKLRKGHKK